MASGPVALSRIRLCSLALQIAALAMLCLVIYEPALWQPPRADQLMYIYMNHGVNGLFGLTIGNSAFNRTVSGGDTLLFRPLLYWLLGVETWTFGYNFFRWQLASLGLHILVAVALLMLLRRTTKDAYTSFGAALLFAGALAGTEMVAWQHISGYLLFCLILILGLMALHGYLELGWPAFGYTAAFLVGLSAFTYELGNVAAILMAATVLWRRFSNVRPKQTVAIAFCFASVPLFYLAFSLGDLYLVCGTIIPSHIPGNELGSRHFVQDGMGVIQAYFYYLAKWLVILFAPSLATIDPGSRITAGPLRFPANNLDYLNLCIAFILLVFFLLALLIRTFRKRLNYASLSVAFTILGILFAYDAILILGRGAERGYILEFTSNSYYGYPVALFVLIIVGIMLGGAFGANRFMKFVPFVALCAITAFAAIGVYQCQDAQFEIYSKSRLSFLNRIMAAEAAAPKDHPFTFSVMPSCPDDPLPWFPQRQPGPTPLPAQGRLPFTFAYVLWPDSYRVTGGEVKIDCIFIPPKNGTR